ncbi:hypothetical protein [Mycoplasmopsis gallinarum]|uniref:hypothetical protein n=1 Tax=Mycoplasmopsis gallinarum TaxID=29557 RepID=UPI000483BE14|nr:hypothetical protein [Mycoplasmopsis gallinarum]
MKRKYRLLSLVPAIGLSPACVVTLSANTENRENEKEIDINSEAVNNENDNKEIIDLNLSSEWFDIYYRKIQLMEFLRDLSPYYRYSPEKSNELIQKIFPLNEKMNYVNIISIEQFKGLSLDEMGIPFAYEYKINFELKDEYKNNYRLLNNSIIFSGKHDPLLELTKTGDFPFLSRIHNKTGVNFNSNFEYINNEETKRVGNDIKNKLINYYEIPSKYQSLITIEYETIGEKINRWKENEIQNKSEEEIKEIEKLIESKNYDFEQIHHVYLFINGAQYITLQFEKDWNSPFIYPDNKLIVVDSFNGPNDSTDNDFFKMSNEDWQKWFDDNWFLLNNIQKTNNKYWLSINDMAEVIYEDRRVSYYLSDRRWSNKSFQIFFTIKDNRELNYENFPKDSDIEFKLNVKTFPYISWGEMDDKNVYLYKSWLQLKEPEDINNWLPDERGESFIKTFTIKSPFKNKNIEKVEKLANGNYLVYQNQNNNNNSSSTNVEVQTENAPVKKNINWWSVGLGVSTITLLVLLLVLIGLKNRKDEKEKNSTQS